jgi:hypothetical protein
MEIQVPDSVREVRERFDSENTPLDEREIGFALWKSASTQPDLTEAQRRGVWAEIAPFKFRPSPSDQSSAWGTYFGPLGRGTTEDGTPTYEPDLAEADEDVVRYWEERAGITGHPVMKARYADVVWDLSHKITGHRPNIKFAHTAVDAYVETARRRLYSDSTVGIGYLTRALNLAISISDEERIEIVRDAMFDLFNAIADPEKMGTWHFLFDELYENKKVPLSRQQTAFLIDSLENILAACIGKSSTLGPGFYAAFCAADRLAKHYRRTGQIADVHRVVGAYGRMVESLADKEAPTMAMARLQQLWYFYKSHGMAEDAKRVQLATLAKGKQAPLSMRKISREVKLDPQELDNFLTRMTEGGIRKGLERIAVHFVESVSATRKFLGEMNQKFPFSSMIPSITIRDDQFTAIVGSVEEDPDGQLYAQMAQSIDIRNQFLAMSFDRLRERYAPKADDITDFVCLSPAIESNRRGLIQDGIAAYLLGDHVKCVHVLLPQIESALRNLLILLGSPPNKPTGNNMGTMQLKNLNDILRDPKVQACLGENIWRYLLVFLADPRGQNARNRVAHGLVPHEHFSRPLSDRVIHVLLTLGLIRKQLERPLPKEAASE